MTTQIRKFYRVNASAGSGKTYQAIRWAIKCAHYDNQKTVIVFKSNELMKQAYGDAVARRTQVLPKMTIINRQDALPITCINSEYLGLDAKGIAYRTVMASILNHLNRSETGAGELLLISEAAFLQMPNWPSRWQWHCICDEIPQIADAHIMNIPDHHKMLSDHLQITNKLPFHGLVSINQSGLEVMQNYADNRSNDEISEYFSPLAKQLTAPYWDVYAEQQSFHRVLNSDSLKGYFQLQFFCLLKPGIFGSGNPVELSKSETITSPSDCFASVTIMGACFDDSVLNYLWPDMNVEFEPHPLITKGLRFTKHNCGNRLQIEYLFEEPWSKYSRDQTVQIDGEYLSRLDVLLRKAKKAFKQDDFIYLVNKDVQTQVRTEFTDTRGHQLPNSPYGLNQYQHINQALILSALNPTPSHNKFLAEMGMDNSAVREAMYHQAAYQAIMRTSLRDPSSTKPVKVIVPDKDAALALREQFVGATVRSRKTGVIISPKRRRGRPSLECPISQPDTSRNYRNRTRRINQLVAGINLGSAIDLQEISELDANCRPDNKAMAQLKLLTKGNYSNAFDVASKLAFPVFPSIHASHAENRLEVDINRYQEFLRQLQEASSSQLTTKKNNVLVTTTCFDADLSEKTNRGLDNITHIWGIWLDIDGGDMPRDQLPKLLPQIRMAVFNSWSKGNYRVFIPTTHCSPSIPISGLFVQ